MPGNKKHNNNNKQKKRQLPGEGVAADDKETPKRGRPRLESTKRYGNEILDLVRNFLVSRGQHTPEGHRLRGNMQVFGAPLSALVRHAKEEGLP